MEFDEILVNNGWMGEEEINKIAILREQVIDYEIKLRASFKDDLISELKKNIEKMRLEFPELDTDNNRRTSQKFCFAFETLLYSGNALNIELKKQFLEYIHLFENIYKLLRELIPLTVKDKYFNQTYNLNKMSDLISKNIRMVHNFISFYSDNCDGKFSEPPKDKDTKDKDYSMEQSKKKMQEKIHGTAKTTGR